MGDTKQKAPVFPSQDILDDLCSRFVLNVPGEDLQSFERLLFCLEQAHWAYEDQWRHKFNPPLRSFPVLKDFIVLLFQRCAALQPYASQVHQIYEKFASYKVRVPVTGAIILDKTLTQVLLVKGWRASASWGFPKGKKAHNEEDHEAAIREVWEETSFDIKTLLDPRQYLEVMHGEQRSRLFVVPGVDAERQAFSCRTTHEIREIAWHSVWDVTHPTVVEATSPATKSAAGAKLFMVQPYAEKLTAWVAKYRKKHKVPDTPPVLGVIRTVWRVSDVIEAQPQQVQSVRADSGPPHAAAPVAGPGAGASGPVTALSTLSGPPYNEKPLAVFPDFRFDPGPIMEALKF